MDKATQDKAFDVLEKCFDAMIKENETLKQRLAAAKEEAENAARDWHDELLLRKQAEQRLVEAERDAERYFEVLKQALVIIRGWHDMGGAGSVWNIYYQNAPEMKSIREAIDAAIAQEEK